MKKTFTPGRWYVQSGEVFAMTNQIRVAMMDREEPLTSPCERDENAKLIAAAPELLESLLGMIDCAELVIERWSSGDLADAVRSLQTDVTFAKNIVKKLNRA
jgi:hypothetical protein